jgi:class 3 adenylate cyclase
MDDVNAVLDAVGSERAALFCLSQGGAMRILYAGTFAAGTSALLLYSTFTDIVGSTERAATIGDQEWRELLKRHHRILRSSLERYGGREVHTAGDGFLATFDSPLRAIECARAAGETLRSIGLEIRAGVHTGEIELSGGDVQGIAVHLGARIAALAGAGEGLCPRR